MDVVPYLFVVLALAVVYFQYRSSRTTAAVASEHQVSVPEGGIEAIEYFWRPG